MTSSLYTLRYDEVKVTRSYHNEINEALCGKILKTYPAKDEFNTKTFISNVYCTHKLWFLELHMDSGIAKHKYNIIFYMLIYSCPVYARCNIFRVKFHWKYQQLWCLLLFHVSHKLSFCYQEKFWTIICILFLKWPRKPFIFWHAKE